MGKQVHIAVLLLVLYGCSDRYRYPCMDSRNWDKEECKPPQCLILQECPEQLLKPDEMKGEPR